jgi:NADPH:quinone reductase-like Zn-dependent oxidoreductase
MKVVEYERFGDESVLSVVDRAAPTPGPGQVLIDVAAAALNPKDVLTRGGKMRFFSGRRFPMRVGYDWSGTVRAVGRGVEGLRPGEEVFGMIQAWAGGAVAEQVVVEASQLAKKPSALSHVQAAALPLAALTALQALRDEGRLVAGQRVLINGASGGVGTFAVQLGRLLGAHVVAVTSARNAELVRSLGASEVVDYATIRASSFSPPVDVFFDVFGNQRFAACRPTLTPTGTWVSTVPKLHVLASQLGSRFSSQRARLVLVRSRRKDLEQLAAWASVGSIAPVIDRVLPMADIAAAQRHLATRRARGKVVLTTR